jgi:hypothetical protein
MEYFQDIINFIPPPVDAPVVPPVFVPSNPVDAPVVPDSSLRGNRT